MTVLLYRGSTKDIFELSAEECLFKFSNRYSIFDWGEMPDEIEGKGESTANLTEYIYRYFEKNVGCPTHLLKMGTLENELVVRRFQVPRNQDVLNFYKTRPQMAFVPLEVIFRLGVPRGSSLIERGLYSEGHLFDKPMIEFSTKLENTDRMLVDSEAQSLAGMNDEEFANIKETTSNLALSLKNLVEKTGMKLWDGKFEFAYIPGNIPSSRKFMLVDSISLDEIRITFDGFPLSKEILRQIYKNSSWFEELKKYKVSSPMNFRQVCPQPSSLNPKSLKLVQELYIYTQKAIAGEINYKEKLLTTITEIKNEHSCLR
jgi:phosphoribosylaminoimidazole-succinocarboxamide synthase